jgi:hypothetical protein
LTQNMSNLGSRYGIRYLISKEIRTIIRMNVSMGTLNFRAQS